MAGFQQPKEAAQQPEDFFGLIENFGSYISKPEVTNVAPNFLVKGSKNVLIDYANRVISRPGYKLYNQANNGGPGIGGSYEWETSTGSQFSLRAYGTMLEFDWDGAYNTLLSNLSSPVVEFAKVLDYNEQQDVLLFVLGTSAMVRWSGGASLVRASTPTSLTKQGILGTQTISSNATISDATPAVVTIQYHGLIAGDVIQFSTTGVLPSPLAINTNYYVIATGLDANDFQFSTTLGGTAVSTNGSSQSGNLSVVKVTLGQGFAFVAGTPGTVAATITDANNNFVNAGFAAGDTLTVGGSPNNSRQFTIGSVTAGVITLIMSDILTSESAGANIVLYNQTGPTWRAARFFAASQILLSTTAGVSSATPSIVNLSGHGLVVGDSIQFTAGTLPSGASLSTTYFVTTVIDPNNFQFSATQGGGAINTTGSAGVNITVVKTSRSILYKGVQYQYAGGENTDTLQGLFSFPAVVAGDAVWQSVDTIPLPTAITGPFPTFYPDLIGVQLNMVFLGSTKSSVIFASLDTDYTNFTLQDNRPEGTPIQQPLTSGPATCIVPVDTDAEILNVQSTLIFGSGRDAFDQMDFHMSADNSQELVRIIRYKTAVGMGLISKGAICPIKNDTVYISREPSLDSLSQSGLEAPDGSKNTPISDPIKNDFDSYDFTGAHVKYWKRAIVIAVPAEGLVLIYDMMRSLWHPPQTIPVSRLGIVADQLIGHSAVTNETYQLFVGTNDNGANIQFCARFAYNNGGRRDRLKNMSEQWTDGYISPNGLLNLNLNMGFEGSVAKKTFPISGSDASIVTGRQSTPLGNAPFGFNPLGGTDIASPQGEGAALYRFFQIDTMDQDDYVEHYVEYTMTTLDGQFAIVAHGSDQWDAGTSPNSHKK